MSPEASQVHEWRSVLSDEIFREVVSVDEAHLYVGIVSFELVLCIACP